jgi:hypothetical protein
MLLAQLQVWHTRPAVPTRRIALGNLELPIDPAPGFGGLLLGSVVAGHIGRIDADLRPDLHRLIDQISRDERVVQPRLRHRFQVDRHGLSQSTHRLIGHGDDIEFEFDTQGTDLAQVLGAVYAVERLDPARRGAIASILHKAMSWRGPVSPALIAHLVGAHSITLAALADPRAWALEILGFPVGSSLPAKKEVLANYRQRMMSVHPDHGGDRHGAGQAILDLNEARRILTSQWV